VSYIEERKTEEGTFPGPRGRGRPRKPDAFSNAKRHIDNANEIVYFPYDKGKHVCATCHSRAQHE
jgi:hypothetical protein